jgi:septum site-determining protein MinC
MKTQNFSFFAFEIATNNFDNIKTEIEKLEFGTHEGVVLVFNVVSFDVGKLPLIIELFAQKQLVVVAVKTTIIEIIEFATFSNIATVDDISPSAVPLSSPTSPQPQSLHSSRPSIIRTDIKSHEQIYVKNTDLVILGDVNSGAEVISDKNIYIYGGGYGKIFAGLTNKNARIFVNFFATKLVCIGGVYREFDKVPKEYLNKSIEISLKDDKLDFKILL